LSGYALDFLKQIAQHKITMPINITQVATTDGSSLVANDIVAIQTALAAIINLPAGKTWNEVNSIYISIQTSDSGYISIGTQTTSQT
jgi:hypothetical protein